MMIVMMIDRDDDDDDDRDDDRDDDADDDAGDQAASGRSLHLMAGSAICFVAPLDHSQEVFLLNSQEVICSN